MIRLSSKDCEYLTILLLSERAKYEILAKRSHYPEFCEQYLERIEYINQLIGRLS
jgi:hypothetical protein